MVIAFLLLLQSLAGAGAPAQLSGTVIDGSGTPVPGAQVFVEAGIQAPLARVETDARGQFAVEAEAGVLGVFAMAEGKAFGGLTVHPAGGEKVEGLTIRLATPAMVEGKVVDSRGAVEGAQVTRIVLLGEEKAGIPLTKLAAYGVAVPTSDAKGRFEVSTLPSGGTVALKINHTNYAQEGVNDVFVGAKDLKVELTPGVLVQGEVMAREGRLPVPEASVQIWNAQPPHDTVLVKSDRQGKFIARLKPGVYRYKAETGAYQSPSWQPLTVTGETAAQEVSVLVAGVGTITCAVYDAVTERPVEGARFVLEANGSTAARAVTGPSGGVSIDAVAGENVLRFDGAPGYLPPETPALKAHVVAGKSLELPAFWLAPVPGYAVQVFDDAMVPVKQAMITLIEPRQIGAWRAGDDGTAPLRLSGPAPAGRIAGLVEDPARPMGGLFAVDAAQRDVAKVQLLRWSSVHGRVQRTDGTLVAGALVSGWAATGGDPVLTWRTTTNATGVFDWPCVVPLAPAKCLVQAGEAPPVESKTFRLEPGAREDLGVLTLEGGTAGTSIAGETFDWSAFQRSGAVSVTAENCPALLVVAKPEEAMAVAEGLRAIKDLPITAGWVMAVLVEGGENLRQGPVPVISGESPATAGTYVLDAKGIVMFETFGLPPLHLLRLAQEVR